MHKLDNVTGLQGAEQVLYESTITRTLLRGLIHSPVAGANGQVDLLKVKVMRINGDGTEGRVGIMSLGSKGVVWALDKGDAWAEKPIPGTVLAFPTAEPVEAKPKSGKKGSKNGKVTVTKEPETPAAPKSDEDRPLAEVLGINLNDRVPTPA